MRYRIKIITYKNGRKEYIPEVGQKSFWMWSWHGLDYHGKYIGDYSVKCETRDMALKIIDLHFNGNTEEQTIEFEYINK